MKQHSGVWCHKAIILLGFIILTGGICKIASFFTVYAIDSTRIFTPDSRSYINTARGFLKTGHFVVNPDMPDVPQIERTPGYPFFIASIFFFFGENYPTLIIIQILISIGTIIVTYFIASAIWEKHIAIIPAFLLSLDYLSFVSSQKVLTETLFTFILSATILAGIYSMEESRGTTYWIVLFGTLLSLATLIRPIAYYAIVLVLIFFTCIWKTLFSWQWKKVLTMVVVLVIPWTVLVGGWQLRNYLMTGSAELSTIQGVNLLFYRGADIVAQRDGIAFEEARQRLGYDQYKTLKRQPDTGGESMAQFSQQWKGEGLRLIFQHPRLFLKSQARGAFKMMFETDWNILLKYMGSQYNEKSGPGGDFFKLPLSLYVQKWVIGKTKYFMLFFVAACYLLLFYVSIVVSAGYLIRTKNKRWGPHAFIWMNIFYFVIISAGPEAYSRFRIPIIPLLSLYAGHGLYEMVIPMIQQITKRQFVSS